MGAAYDVRVSLCTTLGFAAKMSYARGQMRLEEEAFKC
jgi:hypothetical protein